ncbi:MAG TPA: hypothetical protein VNJ04_12300 [Gemmatimonadaceae bacterium]|nr:hypothetical protein [Gemmatimonadaceae bacterium]
MVVLVAGVGVLLGWSLEVQVLKTLWLSDVAVKANTALAMIAGSSALMLEAASGRRPATIAPPPATKSPWVRLPALLVFLIGGLTVLQNVGGFSFGIDEMLVKVPAEVGLVAFPGRMAAITAVALTLLGAGMLLLDFQPLKPVRVSEVMLISSGALALAALLGYVYGAIPTVGLGQGLQIAIPTAVCLFLLAAGGLLLRLDGGFMATFVDENAGGILARRLLPFAFLVPFGLGALRAVSSLTSMSIAMQSAMPWVLAMVAFATVIWRTAQVVSATDRERKAAQQELQTLSSLLPICSYCKMVRNETNYWQQVDSYLTAHAGVELTHSICPDCSDKMMRELDATPV